MGTGTAHGPESELLDGADHVRFPLVLGHPLDWWTGTQLSINCASHSRSRYVGQIIIRQVKVSDWIGNR